MLQKANSKRVLIIFLLQLHLRLNSLRLVHQIEPSGEHARVFLDCPRASPCHAISPDSQAQSRGDAQMLMKRRMKRSSAMGFHELPHSQSDRLCPPWLRCSCLCTLTLGLKKACGGSVPGRTTKAGGHWGPAAVEVRDNQDRSLLHVQNVLFFLWQPHNSQCNYPSGWGAREILKKSKLMECRRSKEGKM